MGASKGDEQGEWGSRDTRSGDYRQRLVDEQQMNPALTGKSCSGEVDAPPR
jgi:hypothetical protein